VACGGGYFIVRPDGTDLHQLPGRPAWSQDGRRLAVETADGVLLVGRPDGTDLNAIGSFPLPAGWAPDGEDFAFVRDSNVWIAHADGSGVRNLTNFELGGVTGASWSPDGGQIAVLQGETIWVFDPDGTEHRRLGTGYGSLDWSPDGSWLAAARDQDTVLFNAGAWHPVLLPDSKLPVWTPDGRYLAVVSSRLASGDSIDLMNADGSARQDVWQSPVDNGGTVESVVWVP
jgi:Tol biopolymer transport system component